MTRYVVMRKDARVPDVWHEVGFVESSGARSAIERLADVPGEYRVVKAHEFTYLAYDVSARRLNIERRRSR